MAKAVTDWKRLLLCLIHEGIARGSGDGSYIEVRELTRAAVAFLGVDKSQVNSVRTCVSRAVRQLIKEGLIVGWYRSWIRFWAKDEDANHWYEDGLYTGKTPWEGVADKRQGPRFVYVELTPAGQRWCRSQFARPKSRRKKP